VLRRRFSCISCSEFYSNARWENGVACDAVGKTFLNFRQSQHIPGLHLHNAVRGTADARCPEVKTYAEEIF
jgi:hypothetical protein